MVGFVGIRRQVQVLGPKNPKTGRPDRLGEADALLVCVPTPFAKGQRPDLRYVVRRAPAPGQLVVLESTTWPGLRATHFGRPLRPGPSQTQKEEKE